jgi:hypothetical protein
VRHILAGTPRSGAAARGPFDFATGGSTLCGGSCTQQASSLQRGRFSGWDDGFPRDERQRRSWRIYLFIASLLTKPSDVEDVYQQTCLALWNKRDQLPQVRHFFSWACGFARNEALHQIRKTSRARHLYMPDELLATLAQEFKQDLSRDDANLQRGCNSFCGRE